MMLLKRQGHVTEELRKQIQQEPDIDILKEWMMKAMDAASIEEFMQSINNTGKLVG